MISIEHLTKIYTVAGRQKKAVDDLSLEVNRGEIFGLLGPNGAGKTTTIKMMTMLTRPTAGRICYDGLEIRSNERQIKKLIGVVPQHINFDQDLSAGENLELHARLHHLDEGEREVRIRELLEELGLSAIRGENTRKLSGGMKRRLLIARAMLHRPRILFMDEPTVALDPQVRRLIWQTIRQMARSGATVFLTTHYIEEAENLCDRVAIMKGGRLLALDTPAAICGRHGGNLEDAFVALTGGQEGL